MEQDIDTAVKIAGFTGTSKGMTAAQKKAFSDLILHLAPDQFHHGDCIGADQEAHILVKALLPDCKIFLHPPVRVESRAFCDPDVCYPPLPYIKRNRNIVLAAAYLLAAPLEVSEQPRGGTWSTIRFAKKSNRPVFALWPDGGLTTAY